MLKCPRCGETEEISVLAWVDARTGETLELAGDNLDPPKGEPKQLALCVCGLYFGPRPGCFFRLVDGGPAELGGSDDGD